jgi:hypothetical protein
MIINSFLHKGQHVLKAVDALLKQFFANFESCTRKKIENKLGFVMESPPS